MRFTRALIVPLLLLAVSCGREALPLPTVLPPVGIGGQATRKIVIAEDVRDDVVICVAVPTDVRFDQRILSDELCGDTVGSLRARFAAQRRAN